MRDLNVVERLQAADEIVNDPKISWETLDNLRQVIEGVNPKLDAELEKVSEAWKGLEKTYKLEVIDVAEALPEETGKEKKRKKAILFFLKQWKRLKAEVKRVQKELERQQKSKQSEGGKGVGSTAFHGGKIAAAAKGPLGVITGAAVLIAGGLIALQSLAVEIELSHRGCGRLDLSSPIPVKLPGFELPSGALAKGETQTLKVPPVKATVANGVARLHVLGNPEIQISGQFSDIVLDGASIMRGAEVDLSQQKRHSLVLVCE